MSNGTLCSQGDAGRCSQATGRAGRSKGEPSWAWKGGNEDVAPPQRRGYALCGSRRRPSLRLDSRLAAGGINPPAWRPRAPPPPLHPPGLESRCAAAGTAGAPAAVPAGEPHPLSGAVDCRLHRRNNQRRAQEYKRVTWGRVGTQLGRRGSTAPWAAVQRAATEAPSALLVRGPCRATLRGHAGAPASDTCIGHSPVCAAHAQD